MVNRKYRCACALIGLLSWSGASAQSVVRVPMFEKGSSTYYVKATVQGTGATDFMVDTSAGYVVIDEDMLQELINVSQAEYVNEFQGVLADGTEIVVPIYRVSSIMIGDRCVVPDVEVAVFPSGTRCILGMNVLRKAAPFTISIDPPRLSLSRCRAPLAGM